MSEKLSVRLDREARAWADWNAEHPDNQSPTTEALLRAREPEVQVRSVRARQPAVIGREHPGIVGIGVARTETPVPQK